MGGQVVYGVVQEIPGDQRHRSNDTVVGPPECSDREFRGPTLISLGGISVITFRVVREARVFWGLYRLLGAVFRRQQG